MRLVLEQELKNLKNMLFEISRYAKESILASIEFIMTGEKRYYDSVKMLEEKSDYLNLNIFEKCVSIIARQQPVAKDLRFVLMSANISSFYERICDIALEICDLQIPWTTGCPEDVKRNIIWMVKKVIAMIEINEDYLKRGEVAGIKENLEKIDDEIDELFEETMSLIVKRIEDGSIGAREGANLILMVRFIERIGDIVAKTGARIYYIEKGKHVWIK